ncbi:hypothetical protein [Rubellicoccus peritrichatus]|uniref:Uncharacterized protein n=1 Tax=Rubellicoccus peritrichatus TaxID=3080537 RepID=A0AAQ3LD50_9BACT|nr:hypothetical protein [Puniceicoccus sp. CR14]WOO43596.1 hypothetical protein RZN69_10900 [Puniceicoccus sp. CR14]
MRQMHLDNGAIEMNKRGGINIPPETQNKLNGVEYFQVKTTDKSIPISPIAG